LQLKGDLRVSLSILYAPNVMVVIILDRINQNYSNAAPMSQVGFWVTELRTSDSIP
jgi:hypothetical protein